MIDAQDRYSFLRIPIDKPKEEKMETIFELRNHIEAALAKEGFETELCTKLIDDLINIAAEHAYQRVEDYKKGK